MTILLGDPRPELERFIAERFRKVHGANVTHFCANLLGLRDATGTWRAAVGYTPAACGPLFLEQYLDAPVDEVLRRATGALIPRARIVEVGNLAAVAPGFARSFMPAFGCHLVEQNYQWAVFTATRQVRNVLARLCFKAHALALATRARLADGGTNWGSYYTHEPTVMAGRLA